MQKISERLQHPYAGRTVLVATKHGKAEILRPIFAELGMSCVEGTIDTDQFGTFSMEVKREGTVLETLRKKIHACLAKNPFAPFVIASEGTFGAHQDFGFLPVGIEALLFYDVEAEIETYAEYVDLNPIAAELEFDSSDTETVNKFLAKINFPETGVIVYPANSTTLVFKGLHSRKDVDESIDQITNLLGETRLMIATDLRANHCPTRQDAIREAGQKMIKKLQELCPACATPGFSCLDTSGALECDACGSETRLIKSEIWACKCCYYQEEKLRADGRTTAAPGECDVCNP